MQLSDLRRMAEDKGFSIADEFVDPAISGAKERRPQLDRLMAEFKREFVRERVCAGLRHAKEQGKQLGRPRIELDIEKVRDLREQDLSYRAIARQMNVSKDPVRVALQSNL